MKKTLEKYYLAIWHEGFLEFEYEPRVQELRQQFLGSVFYSTEIKEVADCLVRQLNALRAPGDISGAVFEVVDARELNGLWCTEADRMIKKYIAESTSGAKDASANRVGFCIAQEKILREKLGLTVCGNQIRKKLPEHRNEHLWKYLAVVFSSTKDGKDWSCQKLVEPLKKFRLKLSAVSVFRHYVALRDEGYLTFKRWQRVRLTKRGLQELHRLATDRMVKKEMDEYGFTLGDASQLSVKVLKVQN